MFTLYKIIDIANGASERDLGEKDLQRVNYLTRRAYTDVKVYDVEIAAGLVAPFFKVAYQGVEYDASQMGSGEYSSLYAWWFVDNAPKGSVLLIEEPETFLSALNQESLLKFLAVMIDERKLCVVMTTHSGHLLHPLPAECLKFLARNGASGAVFVEKPHSSSLEAIGIYLKPDVFIFVEDKTAKVIGRLLLEKYDNAFARRCKLESVGGEAVITKSLEIAIANPFGIRFCGWYDGDQRDKIPAALKSNALALPGTEAFEILFRAFITENQYESQVAFGNNRLSEILITLEGQDCHEWSYNLARALGRDHESVLFTLFELWLTNSANREATDQQYHAIREIVFGLDKELKRM